MHQVIFNKNEGFLSKLLLTLKMIKFQHSIFALPFALASALVATQGHPGPLMLLMLVLAMVTARNAAMSFNRIVDFKFDRNNPRTASRELPSGRLSKSFALSFCIVNAILFILISSYFNTLALILSPVALTIILGYSLTKRFTHHTQIFLGLALGIAPIAVWIALLGRLNLFPILLGLGVLFWVAGFDLIYSTLDFEHDLKSGIKNLVVKMGLSKSLFVARIFHILAIVFLILAGYLKGLGLYYGLGCLSLTALLVYEHSLVKPNDLSRVNMAFFTLNGYVALLYFFIVCLAIYL